MRGLAGLVLSFCDLAEAEGRLLRESVFRTALVCGLAWAGVLFLVAGLAFLVVAAYASLRLVLSQEAVCLVLGAVCGVFGVLFFFSAHKLLSQSQLAAHRGAS